MLTGEHPPGTAKAGGDLVADEQDPVCVAQLPDLAQVPLGRKQDPGGPLNQGLDDHRGDPFAVTLEELVEVFGLAESRLPGVE